MENWNKDMKEEVNFKNPRSPFKNLSNSPKVSQSQLPVKRQSVEEWKERTEVITMNVHINHKNWAREFIEDAITEAVAISKKNEIISKFAVAEEQDTDGTRSNADDNIEYSALKPACEGSSNTVQVITLDDSAEEILHQSEAFSTTLIEKMQKLQIATPKVGNPLKSYSVFKDSKEKVESDVYISKDWSAAQSELIYIKDSDSDDSSSNSYDNCDDTIIENDTTISDTFGEKFINVSIDDTEVSHSHSGSVEDYSEKRKSNEGNATVFLDASDKSLEELIPVAEESCHEIWKSIHDDINSSTKIEDYRESISVIDNPAPTVSKSVPSLSYDISPAAMAEDVPPEIGGSLPLVGDVLFEIGEPLPLTEKELYEVNVTPPNVKRLILEVSNFCSLDEILPLEIGESMSLAPAISEAFPLVEDVVQKISEAFPVVEVVVPEISEAFPLVKDIIPEISVTFPLVEDVVPEISETFPLVEDIVPEISESFPLVEDVVPEISETFPPVEDVVPEISETFPLVEDVVPEISETFPMDEDVVPKISEAFPLVEDIVPEISEDFPLVEGVVPEMNEAFPLVEDVVPEMNETFPLVEDIVPEISESFPLVEDIVPEISDTFPLVEDVVPEISETFPLVEDVVPEISETFPLDEDVVPEISSKALPLVEDVVGEMNKSLPLVEDKADEVCESALIVDALIGNDGEFVPMVDQFAEVMNCVLADVECVPEPAEVEHNISNCAFEFERLIKPHNEPTTFRVVEDVVGLEKTSLKIEQPMCEPKVLEHSTPVLEGVTEKSEDINGHFLPAAEVEETINTLSDHFFAEIESKETQVVHHFTQHLSNDDDMPVSCDIIFESYDEPQESASVNLHQEDIQTKEMDTNSISSDEFRQLKDFEMQEKQMEMDVEGSERRMGMRKSISSLEFDAIAKEALRLLDMPTMTDGTNDGLDTISQDDEFVDADEYKYETYTDVSNFFQNDDELDALGGRGEFCANKFNLARNSLFMKFDPLLANRQSLAPYLLREDESLRRGSALINFSPVKKLQDSTQEMLKTKCPVKMNVLNESILVKINDTVNESTFWDETMADTTVLRRNSSNQMRMHFPSAVASTQTEHEVVLKQDSKETLQLFELKYQDEMLRKSRELDLIKREYEAALSSRQQNLEETNEKLSLALKIKQMTKGLLEEIMQKKELVEEELHEEISSLAEAHQREVDSLNKQLEQKQNELAESDSSAISMMKKFERMRTMIEAKTRNEAALKTEVSSVKQQMTQIKETARVTFGKFEQQIQIECEERDEEKKTYEDERNKLMIMLKMAENKILSLNESLEKKEKECNRMQLVLNEVTNSFRK